MFSASLEDEFAQIADIDFKKTYNEMLAKVSSGKIHLFQTGSHPAMLTNAVEFRNIVKEFFDSPFI